MQKKDSGSSSLSAFRITLLVAILTILAAAGGLGAGYIAISRVVNSMHQERIDKQLSLIEKDYSLLAASENNKDITIVKYLREHGGMYFGDIPVILAAHGSDGSLLYFYSQQPAAPGQISDPAALSAFLKIDHSVTEKYLYPEGIRITAGVPLRIGQEAAAGVVESVTGLTALALIIVYIIVYFVSMNRIERPLSSLTVIKDRLNSLIQQMISGRRIDAGSLLSLNIKHLDTDIKNAILSPMFVLTDTVNRRIHYEKYVKFILAEDSVKVVYTRLYESVNELYHPEAFSVLELNHSLNRLETIFSMEGTNLAGHIAGNPSECPVVRTSYPVSYMNQSPCCSCFPCKEGSTNICMPSVAGGQILGVVMVRFGQETVSEVKKLYGQNLSESDISDLIRSNLAEYVHIAGLASGNIRMMQLYRNQAVTDNLTGLYNRRYLIETLTNYMALARRNQSRLSVIMIDIDHFKKFNDEYGHATGDAVLKIVGKTAKSCLRDSDIIGRYGGEEFIVILPDSSLTEASEVAEKLRRAVAETDYSEWKLGNIPAITVSLGISEFPVHGYSYYHLVNSADRALYRSKQSGRNRVTLHSHLPEDSGETDAAGFLKHMN